MGKSRRLHTGGDHSLVQAGRTGVFAAVKGSVCRLLKRKLLAVRRKKRLKGS